ncbi:C6 zinc finger domain protein [Fusarium sp. NRRL 52700]|nr:C6 zinc finger domain protein [Fusarium sp. NRRL 52700]
MVGVPGKSKGCSDCRERKLKCDLEKPYCGRCTRSGRECGGYERPRIFVHRFRQGDSQSSSPAALSITPRRWTLYVPPHEKSSRLPKSPDPTVHEQRQLISRFINDFCPVLDTSLPECDRLHHYWVYILPHIHGTTDLLDQSILTLSAAFFGQVSGDVKLRQRSMVMYGHAVRDLGKAMSAADFYPDDLVLAAIQCLGMSEIYFPPSQAAVDHGWVSHMKGGAELIKTRGASILNSKLGRDLFIRFRGVSLWAQLVFEASILLNGKAESQRKPFAFTDPCLRSMSMVASQGSHYAMLFHLMLDIPGLLQDVKLLSTPERNSLNNGDAARGIFWRAVTIAETLRAWLDGFIAQYPIPYTWNVSDFETASFDDKFPLHFQFPNLLTAQTLIHYWAAMAILMRCIMSASRWQSQIF